MNGPRTQSFRRGWHWVAVAILAIVLALIASQTHAETMSWTSVNYIVSSEPGAGTFLRRGVAKFANGEVAPFTVEGRITERDATKMRYTVAIVYTFDDGATLRQEGAGLNETLPTGRVVQSGTGRLVSGTGRFDGISGTTSATGRAVTERESIVEFKAEYTMPGRW